MTQLSVVVPVLDEAAHLPALLETLAAQRDIDLEVIVADGGSRDTSRQIATAHGASVVTATRGRGAQMNAGADAARAPWLLFLHADSLPLACNQLGRAVATLKATGNPRVAGHFALRFTRSRPGHALLYRYMEAKSATGRRYTINGDQGLLICRAWFQALGGFDTRLGYLEDQRMAMRIREQGRWLLLPGQLATSARRFEVEGPRKRYWLMALIMAAYAINLAPFFERAPALYRSQADIDPILLTPVFRLLRRLLREMGPRQALACWLRLGRCALGESWQAFFLLDVLLAPAIGARRPATRCHDRLIAPLIHHRLGAVVAAVLVSLVSLGLAAPWYRWRERKEVRGCRRLLQ